LRNLTGQRATCKGFNCESGIWNLEVGIWNQVISAKRKTQSAPKESLRLPTGQAKVQLKAKSETFFFLALSFTL